MRGLIVDLFAGGGGASTGIEWALGRSPDIAINHDPMALAMHKANHPSTKHLVENVWHVRPRDIIGDQPVDLLWASPDCTHFSKAKGAAPTRDVNRAKRSRGLAWVILRWVREAKPRLILMENVEEWIHWGPVMKDGRPDPKRKGETRKRFVRELMKLGYAVNIEAKDKACNHGAPTIRQRLVMVARCDGLPINIPKPTHGRDNGTTDLFAPKVKPWRTAAEIIDWSIPCPSIFTRKKELATATKRRIARGMMRYVIDNAKPFIVPITHAGSDRVHSLDEPLRTVTTAHRGELALATPFLTEYHSAKWPGDDRTKPLDQPIPTQTTENRFALVAPFITKFRANTPGSPVTQPMPTITANSFIKRPGGTVPLGIAAAFMAQHNKTKAGFNPGRPLDAPMSTIVNTGSHQQLVAATITHLRGGGVRYGFPADAPLPALTAQGTHVGLSAAFLTKYYSEGGTDQTVTDPLHTQPTKARFSLVTTEAGTFPMSQAEIEGARRVARFMAEHANDDRFKGAEFVCAAGVPIVDIGMRMLDLRELYRAQGFDDDYIINPKVWRIVRGKLVYGPLTKTDGTRMCGNSVSPYQARAWIAANAPPEMYAPAEERRAA
jgi:DNA (cytosine-5)-methyltransferase 1